MGDWKKKQNYIKKWVNKSVIGLPRKTIKKGQYEQTTEALFVKFSQLQEMGSLVSDYATS